MYKQTSIRVQDEVPYVQKSYQEDVFCDLRANAYFSFGTDLEKNTSNSCFSPFESLCDLESFVEYQSSASEQKTSSLSSCTKKISKIFIIHKDTNRNSNLENKQTSKICNKKLKQARWRTTEDEKVLNLIDKFGEKWTVISKVLGNRTGKQVRDRYNNYLRADVNNSKFTTQEDALLLEILAELGPKWAQIAERIPGRRENQVKNRYYGHLKKAVKSGDLLSSEPEPNSKAFVEHETSERESRFSEITEVSINIASYSLEEERCTREDDKFIKNAEMALGEEQENYSTQAEKENETIELNGDKIDKCTRFTDVEKKKRLEQLLKRKEVLEYFYEKTINELKGYKIY